MVKKQKEEIQKIPQNTITTLLQELADSIISDHHDKIFATFIQDFQIFALKILAFTTSDFFSYNPKQIDPDPDILEIRQPLVISK